MNTYGHGRLLPGDPGYRDTQYDVDQAREMEWERGLMERARHEGPFTPAASDPTTCEFCGRINPLQPDPREWDCCTARRVWAEARYEIAGLRSSLERAVKKLDAVAAREDWQRAPWTVRFDVSGVRLDLYASMAAGS